MLRPTLGLVLEPNTYSILIKNDETNTLSSTGINKQDSFPWSCTSTLNQNLGSSLELIYIISILHIGIKNDVEIIANVIKVF